MSKEHITYDYIDLKYVSAEEVVDKIKGAWQKYGKENVRFEVDIEWNYNDQSATCGLHCSRPRTKAEIEEEKAKRAKAKKEEEAWQRRQYEELKKKFGAK